ncbi:MAG: hypothetical protein ABSC37_09070 [Xanthobacteraceae bacterium]
MMVAAAAQEGEKIAAPIRHAKAEHAAIEFHYALHVGALIGDVAEFQRHHSGEGRILWREGEIGKNFQRGALGILERDSLADARRDVASPLAVDAGLLQPRGDLAEIASRRDLERQSRSLDGAAPFQHDRFQSGFGGENGAVLVPRGKAQPDDAGEIIDHPFDIGGRQRRMACTLDLQHGTSPVEKNSGNHALARPSGLHPDYPHPTMVCQKPFGMVRDPRRTAGEERLP